MTTISNNMQSIGTSTFCWQRIVLVYW